VSGSAGAIVINSAPSSPQNDISTIAPRIRPIGIAVGDDFNFEQRKQELVFMKRP
jgi:hypothetical protein